MDLVLVDRLLSSGLLPYNWGAVCNNLDLAVFTVVSW